MFAYLLALFSIISDLFRDHELSGRWKALWLAFLFFLPILTALVYLIARRRGRALCTQSAAKQNREAVDTCIRDVAGGHAAEIEKAKALLDSGAISQAEYDQLKAKILKLRLSWSPG